MDRDLALTRATTETFDVVVVGGGIYGAWTAYDACLRGLRVALIEREDWGSGTSGTSSKLLHGGLRYLEHYRFGLVRKALKERGVLWKIAPHLARGTRFVWPTHDGDRISRTRLRLGLSLYDFLAGEGAPGGVHHSHSAARARADHPFLRGDRLTGALSYGDCVTDDARLTLEVVVAARDAGAVTLNGVEAITPIGTHVGSGISARDRDSGRDFVIRAPASVAAAGPWLGQMLGAHAPRVRFTKGVHVVLPGLPTEHAFTLTSAQDGRVFFLIPWYGRTLLGTTDTDVIGSPIATVATAADIEYLLAAAATHVQPAWTKADVIASFAGVRTLLEAPGKPPSLSREFRIAEPQPGCFVAVGGKLTSARVDAAAVVDRVMKHLGRPPGKSPTAKRPLPHAPPRPLTDWLLKTMAVGIRAGLDIECAREVALRHGTAADLVYQVLRDDPDGFRRLHPNLCFVRAEIRVAAELEMVRDLRDIVYRRVPLALLARVDEPWLDEAAKVAGEALGWSDERRAAEILAIRTGA